MANQVFGIRVKELREKAGLSMDQLATKLGVSKSRVNMWENSGTIPRGDVLIVWTTICWRKDEVEMIKLIVFVPCLSLLTGGNYYGHN